MANGDGNKSTQKLPKHHSYASQTQDSYDYSGGKAYKDGSKTGSGGKSRDPDGPAPAAGRRTYTSNGD
jgi:hypothetical protein